MLLLMTPMLQETKATMKAKQLDITGAVVSAAALALIIFAVLQGQAWGWWTAKDPSVALPGNLSPVPVLIVGGLLLLFLFAKWERRIKDRGEIPLLDPDMFSLRVFTVGNITDMVESIVLGGMLFIMFVCMFAMPYIRPIGKDEGDADGGGEDDPISEESENGGGEPPEDEGPEEGT